MRKMSRSLALLAITALAPAYAIPPAFAEAAPITDEAELSEAAQDAYIYAYPLVLMEITRRVMTNVAEPQAGKAPPNVFSHRKAFPDSNFTAVVRPNADTLYSILWFDVSREPLIIDVPDSSGRYYLLHMMDMWTDTFASPGTRTTGNGQQRIAIASADWKGALPAGTDLIRSPTPMGWIIGRTQTNGPADYPNVHAFQAGLKAAPLSRKTAPGKVDPAFDMVTPPVEQVDGLSPEAFFSLFTSATRLNPPHQNDSPVLSRMRRLGIVPGKDFSLAALTPAARKAIEGAWPGARARILTAPAVSGVRANGWRTNMSAIGSYGADYLRRAMIAYYGLGANVVEDAVYPGATTDSAGKPLTSNGRYVIHFDKDKLPPARAFWSLAMYNERQFFAENPISRYSIGDRDALSYNPDGSLDLYIQRETPGGEREANWLPAPQSGPFSLTLRLYWPKAQALGGQWSPPPVQRVDSAPTP